jgi:FtsP/CotA-like multicopper oxidase with cupredoxin domain
LTDLLHNQALCRQLHPSILQLHDTSGLQLQFTAPSYLTGSTKLPFAFGPTLRIRAGQSLRISLTNELLQTGNITEHQPHAFAGPMDTNLHTHGLWDANGKASLYTVLLLHSALCQATEHSIL